MKTAADRGAAPFGPWNPGITSRIPRDIRHLATIFRPENVFTDVARAEELHDLTGLDCSELVAFRPERLALHELLIRVTADLSVPDGTRDRGPRHQFPPDRARDPRAATSSREMRRDRAPLRRAAPPARARSSTPSSTPLFRRAGATRRGDAAVAGARPARALRARPARRRRRPTAGADAEACASPPGRHGARDRRRAMRKAALPRAGQGRVGACSSATADLGRPRARSRRSPPTSPATTSAATASAG